MRIRIPKTLWRQARRNPTLWISLDKEIIQSLEDEEHLDKTLTTRPKGTFLKTTDDGLVRYRLRNGKHKMDSVDELFYSAHPSFEQFRNHTPVDTDTYEYHLDRAVMLYPDKPVDWYMEHALLEQEFWSQFKPVI